jgi:hypothetical protein
LNPCVCLGLLSWLLAVGSEFFPVLGMSAVSVLSRALNWVSIMGFDSCLDDM